ncbi:MAG: redoxin domain-containing protein [Planctomycetes bacterium]|nr:redoxin domain-containing protein [Planctomycetota bacterium]
MKELAVANSIYPEIKAQGGEIVAITAGTPEEIKAAAGKLGLDFPFLADPEFKAVDAYGLRHKDAIPGKDGVRPATVFLHSDGTVASIIQPENYRFVDTVEMLKDGFAKALAAPVTSP